MTNYAKILNEAIQAVLNPKMENYKDIKDLADMNGKSAGVNQSQLFPS